MCQVGIASKYFGPIILSINHMMKDVLLFLITFAVIMLAFACGVSYIFNMAVGEGVAVMTISFCVHKVSPVDNHNEGRGKYVQYT